MRPWTEEEERKLRELYPVTDANELANLLMRTRDAVVARASSLGLKKDSAFLHQIRTLAWRKGKKEERRWKESEDEELRRLYLQEYLSVEEIATKLNRTVSAIRNRVRFLGIYRAGDQRNEVGDEGEKLAEEYFGEKGWEILKKGNPITPYDFIVNINGVAFAINVKYAHAGDFGISIQNILRLISEKYKPAFLIIDQSKNVYFMPISWVDFRQRFEGQEC